MPKYLSDVVQLITVEAAFNAELDEHLGYEKHEKSSTSNCRNGYSKKILRTEESQFELNTPRDRESSFELQLVKKHQTRLTTMDSKILSLYAKGMTNLYIFRDRTKFSYNRLQIIFIDIIGDDHGSN
ncbi:transposase [Legionella israelensis]|uniref:Mutator family transposase n=1 Tax=Legionella israelensis TaxID=454 RepID=A0A0W0V2K6_9GAMM|nr:transposase [Legionella israelensis]KTD14318.1 transposase [Legionella israelensis]QBS09750.1 hypothetical protein E4T55_07690 [Legionella israelensis]SCY43067.1 Transposase, Mutator family [Legionella israelensis DSM 19235]STX59290.1 transposase [Legionella israelensis]